MNEQSILKVTKKISSEPKYCPNFSKSYSNMCHCSNTRLTVNDAFKLTYRKHCTLLIFQEEDNALFFTFYFSCSSTSCITCNNGNCCYLYISVSNRGLH